MNFAQLGKATQQPVQSFAVVKIRGSSTYLTDGYYYLFQENKFDLKLVFSSSFPSQLFSLHAKIYEKPEIKTSEMASDMARQVNTCSNSWNKTLKSTQLSW